MWRPDVGERQLALVDQQPGLGAPGGDLVEHLVERQVARADPIAEREPQHPLAVVSGPGVTISSSRSSSSESSPRATTIGP